MPFDTLSDEWADFRRGLAETGHVEGQNVAFEYRTAENHFDRLPELAPASGSARVSVQQMVGFVRKDGDPAAVRELSNRRFGHLGSGLVCGDAEELSGHFAGLYAQGVERFYVWFADFAAPESLHEFGETVIKG